MLILSQYNMHRYLLHEIRDVFTYANDIITRVLDYMVDRGSQMSRDSMVSITLSLQNYFKHRIIVILSAVFPS